MRLRTLPVSVAGVFAALGFNIVEHSFRWAPSALCLLFAVLCQIASNFANEYYDFKAGRDKAGREGPRRGVTEGDITPRAMLGAIVGTLVGAAAVGLSLTYWGGLWLIIPGVLIGLGVLAYSTGPYPLSTHCLGEVAVFCFFGLVPVNLTYYVVSGGHTSMSVFLASCAVGLMGANVLIVNNTRDISDDRSAGKHTLATAFGVKAMAGLYTVNALAAVWLTLSLWSKGSDFWLLVPGIYAGLSISLAFRLTRLKGHCLTPLLGITSVLMLAYTVAMLVRLAVW